MAALALCHLGTGAAHAQEAVCRPATWLRLDNGVSVGARSEVLADMARRDVVLLGESHGEAEHHHWQLHTLSALHALRPDMVIGFEAFPRAAQPVLERWVRGELTFERFLEEVDWKKVWGFDAELYRPLFEFARLNGVPMFALNVSKAERGAVGPGAPASAAYREWLREVYGAHAKKPGAPLDEEAFERFVKAQQAWDRAFAEALAARAGRGGAGTLAVGIVGSGHLRHGHGVAHQLADLGVPRVGTLLPLHAGSDCDEIEAGLADAVFLLPGTGRRPAARDAGRK